MAKIIFHIDLDAFFCRAEEIKDPSLEGKPFIVGGEGRRGIVATCSYKAREYGIHSGMPTFQAKMLCKDIIIKNSDYKFYQLLSNEFINFIKKYTKLVQQVSIDECFADFTDYYHKNNVDIQKLLKEIQLNLFKQTKLKCSIGVATTKFLAKMASDYKKPMGITIIHKKDIKEKLFNLPVKDFYGIGKKTVPRLNNINVFTIGDLYNFAKNEDQKLKEVLGIFTSSIIPLLEGKSSDEVIIEEIDPKSIGMSRTFDEDTNNIDLILPYLENEIDSVLHSLKKENKFAKTITITYKNAAHDDGFKSKSFSKTFNKYTNDELFIKNEAIKLFKVSFNNEVIRLIGFSVKNFKNKKEVATQMTFDDYLRHEKESKSFLIINELNRELNKKAFIRLSEKDK